MLPDRFLQHAWSNLTSMFLNFEGAGSGGYVLQPSPPVDLSRLEPLFLVDLSSSDLRRTTSSNSSALHRIYMPMFFLKTLGTEVSFAQIRITPSTLPLARGTFPASQRTMRMPLFTDMKGLGVACRVQTSPFIAHVRDTIRWMIRSVEWVMRVRRGRSGL